MASKGERAIYQHHESLLAMGISFSPFFFSPQGMQLR